MVEVFSLIRNAFRAHKTFSNITIFLETHATQNFSLMSLDFAFSKQAIHLPLDVSILSSRKELVSYLQRVFIYYRRN